MAYMVLKHIKTIFTISKTKKIVTFAGQKN